MASVGIIGGGIAGLTAAYRLVAKGYEVMLFEATGRVGGMIRSEHADGYLIEHGPNALQTSTPLLDELIGALGLEGALIEAAPAARKRYVVREGRPVALPSSPLDFLATPLFSPAGKLRLLAEPFVRAADPDREESVADFVRRRLGREALDYGANPFVGGVFAGDPERLSLCHAFPRLHELEQAHGSLLMGLLRRLFRREERPAPRRRTFSFEQGLEMLPARLAQRLGSRIRCNAPVTALRREGGHWLLSTARGGNGAPQRFDAVLYAAPLHRLGALDFGAGLGLTPLLRVPYPPVSLVALGFRREQVAHPLDGFGLLVPEVEADFQILGTLFSSTLFPDRTPAGHVLLTTFVGGARHPALGRADRETLLGVVRRDLRRLLGVHGAPSLVRHIRWEHAIPQYHLGYGRVKWLMERLERLHPGFFMAGNYRAGVSVGDAAASGGDAARRITAWLDDVE